MIRNVSLGVMCFFFALTQLLSLVLTVSPVVRAPWILHPALPPAWPSTLGHPLGHTFATRVTDAVHKTLCLNCFGILEEAVWDFQTASCAGL